jgi:probable HAF family extracellular repeat protein
MLKMKTMKPLLILVATASLCFVPSLRLVAQDATAQQVFTDQGVESKSHRAHRRYILKDLGTLGGPWSGVGFFAKVINNRGTVVVDADTSIPDPFAPNCLGPNCLVTHGFKWQNSIKTDLGTLPGGGSSDVNYINELGQITGRSQNGLVDPLTGLPETVAVLWKNNGGIIDLGTLGGNQGLAVAINNSGQAIGMTTNTISDAFSLFDPRFTTQTRAFLWQRRLMRDLGTLGGPDAFATYLNESGQVTGISYTNAAPNDTTGIPTVHPFLWEDGRMRDLGSLGGTLGFPNYLNSRGQVVGIMTLPGDESQHPFLWERGRLIDLGTFGGSNGEANWMNDAGEVVGSAFFPGDTERHAFLWRHGVKTDLGAPTGDICSNAYGINSESQVVGTSGVCHGAVDASLWEHGSAFNLNTLIPPHSSLHLVYALSINDRGEIAGIGVPPGISVQDVESLGHAFLLIPVGDDEEDATRASLVPDQQWQVVGRDDTEGATVFIPQNNVVTGDRAAPSRVQQVNDDQIPDYRRRRFSRRPLAIRKHD